MPWIFIQMNILIEKEAAKEMELEKKFVLFITYLCRVDTLWFSTFYIFSRLICTVCIFASLNFPRMRRNPQSVSILFDNSKWKK